MLFRSEGILAYSINIENVYKPKDFPVKILARESDSLRRPFSPSYEDIDRFLEATLNPGQFVDTGDYLIESLSYDGNKDEVLVSFGEARVERFRTISIATQAEAEAKAKAEAEARAKGIKKSITCSKGKKVKVISGKKPKCPKGYKKAA